MRDLFGDQRRRVSAPHGMSPKEQLRWVFQHVRWLQDSREEVR